MQAFVTRSDLEAAAQQAVVSMETRNHFLNKLLLGHGHAGIRKQLHSLWTEWVDNTYCEQQTPAVAASLGMEVVTQPASDDDNEACTAAASGGGSG